MIDFLIKLFQKTPSINTGANLVDPRQEQEQKNDIYFNEIVASANTVNWTYKPREQWRKFPELNQYNSYTCGAQSLAKALGIAYGTKYGTYIPFSRADIYQRRINKTTGGMSIFEMDLIAQGSVTLEQLTPKEIKTDYDADNLVIENFKHDVGKIFANSGLIYLDNDIETIASVIQTTGKGVILMTYFIPSEWSKEYPIIENYTLNINFPSTAKHFITVVDFTLFNGEKCLIIEDSAWFGGINRRIISKDWMKNRVVKGAYPMKFRFEGTATRPSYQGTIISLQTCLESESLFPSNISKIESFGPLTRKGLGDFQRKYNLPVNAVFPLDKITELKFRLIYP